MLSRTAVHAIRAALFLARTETGWASAGEVADALGAPRNYLGKTLHALTRRGLVEARRGRNGGYRLAVPAQELTLAAIIEGVDEMEPPRRCLLWPDECSDRAPCVAHWRWSEVTRRAWAPLERTTLADLLASSSS